jgi:ankyrin repeat protein
MLKKLFSKKYTVESFNGLLLSKMPDLEEIKQALGSGYIDVDYIDENGETFLHYSIKKNSTASAIFLIEYGIEVDIKDNDGCTPIYLAIAKSNRMVVQSLLTSRKVNLNQLHDNRTLLQDAILQGERHIVNMLLKTNINKNHTDSKGRNIIFDAISNGNERLIDTILNIDGLDLNIIDDEHKTILHQKNIIEDDQLAKKLIKKGADPTILDEDEKSYLLHVALRGMETEEIIDAAIESGVNLNASVRNKNSILMEIMFSFSKASESETSRRDDLMSMATKLVNKGIDVNAINDDGETALFDAARKLDVKACAFLINENVDVNVINKKGDSVLSEIIYKGVQALDIIYLLVTHNANINIKNSYNQGIIEILNELVLYTHNNTTPLDPHIIDKIVPNGQYLRVLSEILRDTSYNGSALSSTGEPMFFKSLLNDNNALFDLYYKIGIDINATDQDGNTIFARYIDKIGQKENIPQNFRENLLMLITRKVNVNFQDSKGRTILSKLISTDNMRMFRVLFEVTKFDYSIQDNMGYTIIHNCIITSNITVLKLIDQIVPKLKNIPDNSGILPITYAALFGKVDLVLELINLESYFTSATPIAKTAKIKFSPLLKNLDNLTSEDENEQHKIDVLKDQIIRDFK